jgi:hypothetical protein
MKMVSVKNIYIFVGFRSKFKDLSLRVKILQLNA